MSRVRHSFSKSFYHSIVSDSRDSESGLRDFIDSNARGFDENVLLVDPKFSPVEASDTYSKIDDDENVRSNSEPIVKISPPTPLKRPLKNDATAIATETSTEEQRVFIVAEDKATTRRANLCEESESFDVPSQNSIIPHDVSRDRRVYSKETCPFHRYEPAMKIFDDDIEKYLIDDPRASVSLDQKLSSPRNTKYNKAKSAVTFVESKNIKRITLSREKLEYRSNTNAIDLTASKIPSIESRDKGNDTLNKQRDFESLGPLSDIFISDVKFSSGKELIKGKKVVKNLHQTSTTLPKLFQPRDRIKTTSEKLTKSPKYMKVPKIRNKLLGKSE